MYMEYLIFVIELSSVKVVDNIMLYNVLYMVMEYVVCVLINKICNLIDFMKIIKC